MKILYTIIFLVASCVFVLPAKATNTHSADLENGSSQYYSITNASQTNLDITTDFTVEAWMKLESSFSNYEERHIYWRHASTAGINLEIYNDNGTMTVYGYYGTGSTNRFFDANFPFVVDKWYHVAVSCDISAATCIAYVNGTAISTTMTGSGTTIGSVSTDAYVGAGQSSHIREWDGLLDDVRIWSDVRTAAEIANNMAFELDGDEAGLVSWWKFDNDATDENANGNDLTNNNSITYDSTDVGYDDPNSHSIDLELGSSQWLSIADASQTGLEPGSSDFSMEAWIKMESLPESQLSIITKGFADTPSGANFHIEGRVTTGQDRLKLNIAADASDNTVGYGSTDLNQFVGSWIHVAVTVDMSAATMIFYINGIAETTAYTTQAATSQGDNSSPYGIGGSTGYYFDGLIDDVRHWSDIRTATEIANNFTRELDGDEAGLVAYWQLNNDALDLTSNDNDLTENNSPVYDTDVGFRALEEVVVAIIKRAVGIIMFGL